MGKAMGIFFILCTMSLAGMLYFLAAARKPGMYPPKNMLKKRAEMLGVLGCIFLLLGLIGYMFH
ncbi:hypothetical protein ACFVHQ_05470 [Actinomycetes bacterium NPDC127524]